MRYQPGLLGRLLEPVGAISRPSKFEAFESVSSFSFLNSNFPASLPEDHSCLRMQKEYGKNFKILC